MTSVWWEGTSTMKIESSYLSRMAFLLPWLSGSSCRLGWLMYSTVRLKKEFHTCHKQETCTRKLLNLGHNSSPKNHRKSIKYVDIYWYTVYQYNNGEIGSLQWVVQTPTLKSKSASEKFLCNAGDRNCVVTTMMLQKNRANINICSSQSKAVDRNRWQKFKNKRLWKAWSHGRL